MTLKIRVSRLASLAIWALAIFVAPSFNICHAASLPVGDRERTYTIIESTFPKNVIQIVEVKNLQSPNFTKTMEIIVKNLTDKPIYGITLVVRFSDYTERRFGSKVHYGEGRLLDYREIAAPGAKFIKPGETGIVKMEPSRAKGFLMWIESGELPLSATYNIRIIGQTVSFGDGTGYTGIKLYPEQTSNLDLKEPPQSLKLKPKKILPGWFNPKLDWSVKGLLNKAFKIPAIDESNSLIASNKLVDSVNMRFDCYWWHIGEESLCAANTISCRGEQAFPGRFDKGGSM